MTSPGVTAPRSIPASKSIATLLTLTNHGTTGAVANQGAALCNLYDDNGVLWHEGLLKFEVKTTGGKGATPTSPGTGKTFSFFYAFTDTLLDAVADASVILAPIEHSLVCNLPDAVSTQAFGTLTFTGLPTNGQTVTIGSISGSTGRKLIYKFVTVLSGSPSGLPFEVLIGADATGCADNLKAAINSAALLGGVTYGVGTPPHPDVSAANTAGVLTVTANNYNTSGNAITTTETCINASWGGATLASGSAAATAIFATDALVHTGKYLYTWYDRDAFAANALIDVLAKLIRI